MTKICLSAIAFMALLVTGCNNVSQNTQATNTNTNTKPAQVSEAPEWFQLRPEVEKTYGYTHAVRTGDDLKISGAVSMDDKGELTAKGDLEQQMKNCYAAWRRS